MAGQVVLVAATSILLAAAAPMPATSAAPMPATLEPPATGSMYDGNNVHPPNLAPPDQQAPAAGHSDAQTNGQAATGANIQGGHGAAQGGGG